MKLKTVLARGACLLAVCSVASVAAAQTTPTAPATPARPAAAPTGPVTPSLQGAPITGMCYFSFQRVLATSTVGRAVGTRMQQIQSQVTAELNAEGTPLQNDIRTFETQRASLDQATLQQRGTALQNRIEAFQRKQAQRQREMEFTQQYVGQRLQQEIAPLMMQAAGARQCSVLLNDDIVMAANPAMDITPAVVTALNGRIQTLQFDRIQVNPQTGQPILPGGAAAPARPATPAR